MHDPAAVPPFQHVLVDERPDELLDEERVAFGAADDEPAQRLGQLDGHECLQQPVGVGRRQRVQLDRLRSRYSCTPAGPDVQELGPRRPDHEERAVDVGRRRLEELEKSRIRPVEILDEDHRRPVRDEVLEEGDPRPLEAVARHERVQVRGRLEPEERAEQLAPGQPTLHDLRCVGGAEAELLAHDLAEREVGDALPVRQAAADPADRLG